MCFSFALSCKPHPSAHQAFVDLSHDPSTQTLCVLVYCNLPTVFLLLPFVVSRSKTAFVRLVFTLQSPLARNIPGEGPENPKVRKKDGHESIPRHVVFSMHTICTPIERERKNRQRQATGQQQENGYTPLGYQDGAIFLDPPFEQKKKEKWLRHHRRICLVSSQYIIWILKHKEQRT